MSTVIISIVCTLAAWLAGAVLDMSPNLNAPGLPAALAVSTMGGFIMYQLKKKK